MDPNSSSTNLADKRDNTLKWNGWGHADTHLFLNHDGDVYLTGNRYEMSGVAIQDLGVYMRDNIGAHSYFFDLGERQILNYPDPIVNEPFLEWLRSNKIKHSTDGKRRVNRSHGHNVGEIMRLRAGQCEKRIPDIIVWPKNHQEVVNIVQAANETNAVIIPFGGGTNVSGALSCPVNESRCIVSLDMCDMNKILWVDAKNQLARAECGVIGGSLEKQLNEKGFTIGHEPDSIEFSSLGGWVATRASGIKKNKYGNIEDIIVNITLVTSKGVLNKSCSAPRVSAGPDIHHFVIGSEGTLGVVTEVTFKICHLPECRKFGSILFPTFEQGIQALREFARQKLYPASVRLMDNDQFKFSQALRPGRTKLTAFADVMKFWYLEKIKHFDLEKVAPATLLFEGSKEEVDMQERKVYNIASKFGGIKAGTENGRYGYNLTFYIGYLRDAVIDYYGIGESFETSVPWDKVELLCRNVKELCIRETTRMGGDFAYCCCRVTQLYDSGACVYFYFGFNYRQLLEKDLNDRKLVADKAVDMFEKIENAARNEILNCGGSISHHHGVGKIRSRWLPQTVGQVGLGALKAVKEQLDPNNIFACGNLYTVQHL